MLSRTFLWPQGYTSAAMISVNLDAEFYGRIFYPGIDVSEGDIQRLGWTGMEYGLPHLLDCFREHGVKGTFFIPGRVAELYPDAVRAIADAGHELGCHGYEHEILAHFTPEEQLELLKKAKAAIEKAAGRAAADGRAAERGGSQSASAEKDVFGRVDRRAGRVHRPLRAALADHRAARRGRAL